MSPADQMLFEQWRVRRDPEAFRQLVEQYAGMTYAVGRRITGNEQDAEDVAQVTFETLASQRNAIRVHLGAWLHRVATYRALSLRRSERRRVEREARYESGRPRHTEIRWDDIYDLVDETIAALPEKQREAVIAYYFEGKTHQAIALAVGVSRPAVSQRLQAGVEGIRKGLKRRGVAVSLTALGGLLVQGVGAAVPTAVAAKLGKIALAGCTGKAGLSGGLWQTILAWPGAAKGAATAVAVATVTLGGYWLLPPGVPVFEAPAGVEQASAPVVVREAPETLPALADAPVEAVPSDTGPPVEWATTFAGRPPVTTSVSGVVVDEIGRPLPDAQVSASLFNERMQLIRKSVRADEEDGRFTLRNLTAGSLSLVAMPPGWYVQNAADEPGAIMLELRTGQDYDTVRLTVNLAAYRSISGRVVDGSGRPIAGARVRAWNKMYGSGHSSPKSNADGRYEIPYLRVGEHYQILAEATGKSPGTVDKVQAGSVGVDVVLAGVGVVEGRVVDAVTGAPLEAFRVQLGPVTPVGTGGILASALDNRGHFRLEGVHEGSTQLVTMANGYRTQTVYVHPVEAGKVLRDTVILMEPRPDGTLEGWVLDSDRNPLVNARVQVLPEGHGHIDRKVGSTRSGVDGSFQVGGVGDDAAYVVVVQPGYALGKVAIPEVPDEPIVVTLERGGTVSGLVTIAGAPVAGVNVRVREEATNSGFDATTGPDGRYRIAGVTPGAARVSFNYLYYPLKERRTGSTETVVSARGETVVDMAFSAATSALEGTVTQDGAPVSNMPLRIATESAAGVEIREARTDADGNYLFEFLPAGLATITVRGAYTHGATELTIELPPDTHLYQDIALDHGIRLHITLENVPAVIKPIFIAAFGDDAEAFNYESAHEEASALVFSAPGLPAVLSGLEPGNYTVIAWAFMENGAASMTSVEITVGDAPETALTLSF